MSLRGYESRYLSQGVFDNCSLTLSTADWSVTGTLSRHLTFPNQVEN